MPALAARRRRTAEGRGLLRVEPLRDEHRSEPQTVCPAWRNTRSIATLDCPLADDCVLTAIGKDVAILEDRRQTDEARLLALKLLGHWVADIHQPMHVGYQDDQGANWVPNVGECERNLHATWDSCIIETLIGGSPTAVVVDEILGEEEVFVRPIPVVAGAPSVVEGIALLASGRPVAVLSPARMSPLDLETTRAPERQDGRTPVGRRILLADAAPLTGGPRSGETHRLFTDLGGVLARLDLGVAAERVHPARVAALVVVHAVAVVYVDPLRRGDGDDVLGGDRPDAAARDAAVLQHRFSICFMDQKDCFGASLPCLKYLPPPSAIRLCLERLDVATGAW